MSVFSFTLSSDGWGVHSVFKPCFVHYLIIKPSLEPIGGSSPKFSAESSISNLIRVQARSLAMSCPAQASPVPSFRSVSIVTLFSLFRTHWKLSSQVLNCDSTRSEFPCWTQSQPCLSSPGLPHSSIQVGPWLHLTLGFSAPVGTSAPKFSVESKTSSLVRQSNSALGLSCNAQASPKPSFR